MNVSEYFYSASLQDLKNGYVFDPAAASYYCLICGEGFEDGDVYPAGNRFMEARKYVLYHIGQAHGSMLEYLLGLDKKATGLTDLQKQLIGAFASGQTDAETVKMTGAGSASTIRNHRFALKEKARQAKLFLATMELMEAALPSGAKFMPVHRAAPQVDERYALTQEEYAKLLAKYLPDGLNGPLTGMPRKEKQRAALLRHISTIFQKDGTYSEAEVNDILRRFLSKDYATLRRQLIDYRFLSRESDGSAYWLTV
ncbi:DUF2087 domain-containing protein [Paenibacillus sepulcri]|uniref:DUF2087 domain-containing protein n=1 Tax=Paenibacillus sepulcri TaxID=359917 RepID=A0ABS7C8J5_9BACL|nr:DUF2087 domain-containing protein [Paenibacillus sepulcri]